MENIFDQKRSYAKKRKIEEKNEMQMLLEAAESLKVRKLEVNNNCKKTFKDGLFWIF